MLGSSVVSLSRIHAHTARQPPPLFALFVLPNETFPRCAASGEDALVATHSGGQLEAFGAAHLACELGHPRAAGPLGRRAGVHPDTPGTPLFVRWYVRCNRTQVHPVPPWHVVVVCFFPYLAASM